MKKLLSMLLALSLLLCAFSALAEGGKVKITAWVDEDGANTKAYLAAFNEAYPEYEVELVVYQDDDLKEQLTIAISAGTAPTIIRGKPGSQLTDYVNAGAMLPLDEFAEKYGWYDLMYDDIQDALTYDGKLYEVPIKTGGNWGVLYYNADMAAELGIDLTQPMTIDEFLGLKDTVEAAGYQLLSLGDVDLWPGVILYGDYLMQAADPTIVEKLNSGELKWNESEEILTVFDALQRLGTGGAFISGWQTLDHIQVNQAWAAGKTLTMYCGTWWPSTVDGGFDGVPFEIHAMPLPRIAEGYEPKGQQFFANEGYGINANATPEEAEAAAAFLDYYWNIEGQKVIFSDLYSYQCNKIFNDNLEEYGCEIRPLFREEAFTSQSDLPQTNYSDWAYDTSVMATLKDRIADLFTGSITPQQAADAIEEVQEEVFE